MKVPSPRRTDELPENSTGITDYSGLLKSHFVQLVSLPIFESIRVIRGQVRAGLALETPAL